MDGYQGARNCSILMVIAIVKMHYSQCNNQHLAIVIKHLMTSKIASSSPKLVWKMYGAILVLGTCLLTYSITRIIRKIEKSALSQIQSILGVRQKNMSTIGNVSRRSFRSHYDLVLSQVSKRLLDYIRAPRLTHHYITKFPEFPASNICHFLPKWY